jgi:hypothetical protein
MKKLLPFVALLLVGCHKYKDYRCVCTYPNGKVLQETPHARGWRNSIDKWCEEKEAKLIDSISVACRMYNEGDDFTKCQEIVTSKFDSKISDTDFIFFGYSAAQIEAIKAQYTFNDTIGSSTNYLKHYMVCSDAMTFF